MTGSGVWPRWCKFKIVYYDDERDRKKIATLDQNRLEQMPNEADA